MKVTNRQAGDLVRMREEFTTANGTIFSRWETPFCYVVYSYGEHWPLHIWDRGQWYSNADRYSVTTSRHFGLTHPGINVSIPLPCVEMIAKVNDARRLAREMRCAA